ncbi:MAG: UTRA domain-containing protein [Candidatus Andeanibacterium colombiense]|uniref:UTRA domain-containing protein n=1 Tax=Candidatus Andeanibacterium colombiense TaxID=3121345 RepID=A0AAJ5X4M0_9SPHN|nr:MAG: UTRA domain-containing protein [Sphingomonadaceae bacterium]
MKPVLHENIRSDFEARILSGELAPGERLPTEQDLIKHYGCSRMTVNKALSALATAGLIDRRKRAGTFVSRPRVHSMALDVPDLPAQIRERGEDYRYALDARRLRAPVAGNAMETWLAGKSRELLELDGVHLADGVAIAFEHRLIGTATVPAIVEAHFDTEPPGTWLLRHVPWTEAETRISAAGAGVAEAALLGVAAGEACLCIERRTWRADEPITYVRQLFLAHSYDLIARFGPAGENRSNWPGS